MKVFSRGTELAWRSGNISRRKVPTVLLRAEIRESFNNFFSKENREECPGKRERCTQRLCGEECMVSRQMERVLVLGWEEREGARSEWEQVGERPDLLGLLALAA